MNALWRRLLLVGATAVPLLLPVATAEAVEDPVCRPSRLGSTTVQTVPPVPGLVFRWLGRDWRTGADGTVAVPQNCTAPDPEITEREVSLGGAGVARFERWYGKGNLRGASGKVSATMSTFRSVRFALEDLEGETVTRSDVGVIALKSSTGFVSKVPVTSDRLLLQATRVVPDNSGLEVKDLYYTVQAVDVQGNNVVNRSQVKFFPRKDTVVTVPLLFFDAAVRARDALFGFGVSGTLRLEYPNGYTREIVLGKDGRVALPGLPRGQYHLSVTGPGLELVQPVAMSRRQDISLKVFTWLDVATVLGTGLVTAVGLVLAGRRLHHRHRRVARHARDRPVKLPVLPEVRRFPRPPAPTGTGWPVVVLRYPTPSFRALHSEPDGTGWP